MSVVKSHLYLHTFNSCRDNGLTYLISAYDVIFYVIPGNYGNDV